MKEEQNRKKETKLKARGSWESSYTTA